MNLSRIIAKQFAGSSTVKIFPRMNLGKLEQGAEWIKWLTYSLSQRKHQVMKLKQKNIDLLTAKELEFLLNYAQDEKILAYLNHVRNSVAPADEAMAKETKTEYLKEKLSSGQYEQLSMIDAYVLHIALYHDIVESEKCRNREIRAKVKENTDMAFRNGQNERRNY